MTTRHFPIRQSDKNVFDAIGDGTKSVETRAASPRYVNVKPGDHAIFDCGGKRQTKIIKKIKIFSSVTALLRKYPFKKIAPWCASEKEVVAMYNGFSGYRELIKRYGIIAMELE